MDTQGDAFFVAFPTADGGLAAAREAQAALAGGPIQVRMGLHTGEPAESSPEPEPDTGSSGADEGIAPLAPETYEPEPEGPTTSTAD